LSKIWGQVPSAGGQYLEKSAGASKIISGYSLAGILVGFERLLPSGAYCLTLKENAMPQTIIGQNGLFEIDYVASMLRALLFSAIARSNIDANSVDWRAIAERVISNARAEAAKSGGSVASAEQMFMLIFNWAIDERLVLTRASQ